MMANKSNTVLYIGVTNNLKRRTLEHKDGLKDGFTKKYNCKKLVWYKGMNSIIAAIKEEKRMKKWKRIYKENVINKVNPGWKDLYYQIGSVVPVHDVPGGGHDRNDDK